MKGKLLYSARISLFYRPDGDCSLLFLEISLQYLCQFLYFSGIGFSIITVLQLKVF